MTTKKKNRIVYYDVLSPDGFSIRFDEPPFKIEEEIDECFEKWKDRYALQGYYSSNGGRIPLDTLKDYCKTIRVDKHGTPI